MAIIKPSARYTTHKIGSSSDPTKPIGADDLVIVESADTEKYPDKDDRVRVAKQRDIVEDYFGVVVGKNLFDKTTMIKDGFYVNIGGGTGNYYIAAAADWGCSDFVPVLPQTAYILTNPQYSSCPKIYYNSSKQKIGDGSGASFTTPADCYFIRFTLYDNTSKAAFGDGSGVQIELGSTATAVEAYYRAIALDGKGLPSLSVTSDKLANSSVTSDKLANSSVTSDKLANALVDSLLSDNDKYVIRDCNLPLSPNREVIRSAISLYGAEEDIPVSDPLGTFFVNAGPRAVISSYHKRIFDTNWFTNYKYPNINRVNVVYSSASESKYSPYFHIRITLEDLKRIGIDVSDPSYTTKQVSIRFSIGNYVGWPGNQLFMYLCYTEEPKSSSMNISAESIVTTQLRYTCGASNPALNPTSTNMNLTTGEPLSIEYQNETVGGESFRFLRNINLHKTLIDTGGVTRTFKGIVITILSSGASGEPTAERGFDLRGLAVCNSEVFTTLTATTNTLNWPDEVVVVPPSEITKQQDYDNSIPPADGQVLLFDGATNKFKPQTLNLDSKRVVNIVNSDKIAFFGCSYTESYYAVRNKSWVNKLAQTTDWILANFGVSGQRITDEVERLSQNTNPYHSTVKINDLKPTIVSFANVGNESLDGVLNMDMYRQELIYAQQYVKSIGAEMIMGTDHFSHNSSAEMMMASLSKELGIPTISFGVLGGKIIGHGYPGFWGGGDHPATRTNAHTWLSWSYFINTLPRPKRSIKLFRVRSEYLAGAFGFADLNYDTIQQRMKKYQEINSGEVHLTETNDCKYYDRLDESFEVSKAENEYCKLIAKEPIEFNKAALVEVVIDRLQPTTCKIYVAVSEQPAAVYLANNNNTSLDDSRNGNSFEVTKAVWEAFSYTPGTSFTSSNHAEPQIYEGKYKGRVFDGSGYYLSFSSSATALASEAGTLVTGSDAAINYIRSAAAYGRHRFMIFDHWEKPWSLFTDFAANWSYSEGYVEIVLNSTHHNYFQYDKVRVLLTAASTFNITDVYAEYEGGFDKIPVNTTNFKRKESFTEINKNYSGVVETGFPLTWDSESGGLWVAGLAPSDSSKQMPSTLRDYPSINNTNRHIELGYDAVDGFPTIIKKTLPVVVSNRGFRKVVVRVVARLFPKVYNQDVAEDDYTTQTRQIKPDSYDLGTLVCGISLSGSNYAVSKHVVDIGWGECYFEFDIPQVDTENLYLMLYRDESDKIDTVNYRNHLYPMQIYDVSVQVDT